MTSSGWITRPRRRWGSWPGGWPPTRSGWCSRPGNRVRSWPGCRSSKSEGCARATRGRCWTRRWPGRWTIGSGTRSWPRRRATRWRCWNCRGGCRPRSWQAGSGCRGAAPLSERIAESFRRQLEALPEQSRRLLLLAAAEPYGDLPLIWRAAGRLGIPVQAAAPAVDAGLVEFGTRVRFRHPLLRSASYRAASVADRQAVHGALAEATDPETAPERRAWHRAQAAAGPDEEVAAELERSAGRAQARGGLAAAAAFLERSALLTADPARRADRTLAAAQAHLQAGAFGTALGLLATAAERPGRWMSCRAPGWTCCAGRSCSPRAWAAKHRRCCSRRPSGSSRSTATWPGTPT